MSGFRGVGAVFLLLGVVLASAGCLSAGGTDALVVKPADPTPLAKCSVKKSQASPLVTEWPASEKAHLEGMLGERAVVVSYSGCEMRILDSCRVQGSYRFTRTTLSRDTIEISDADELYAKIPLGAVGLEGELERSGRLAVRTTIAGQMRLDGSPELPDSDACRDATHVIAAMSVGAFELVSGGAVKGHAGVSIGNAGGGVKGSKEEQTMRSAGDPKECGKGGKDPSPDCASPIQVFLEPVSRGDGDATAEAPRDKPRDKPSDRPNKTARPKPTPAPAAPEPDRDDEPPPKRAERPRHPEPDRDKSLSVDFEPPEEGQRWVLVAADGTLLCKLPCTRRVANNSGYRLQLEAEKREDIKAVAVPPDLGSSPGNHIKAVPQPAQASAAAGLIFYAGLLGTVVGVIVAAPMCKKMDPSGNPDATNGEINPGKCYGTLGATAGVAAIGAGAGIYFFVSRKTEAVNMTLIDDRNAKVQLTPTGLVGSF